MVYHITCSSWKMPALLSWARDKKCRPQPFFFAHVVKWMCRVFLWFSFGGSRDTGTRRQIPVVGFVRIYCSHLSFRLSLLLLLLPRKFVTMMRWRLQFTLQQRIGICSTVISSYQLLLLPHKSVRMGDRDCNLHCNGELVI